MLAHAKNMAKGLVVSKKSPIFALPNHLFVGKIKSYEALLGVLLLHFCTYGGGGLATKQGVRPFCTAANCVQQCQTTTQSASARSTVRPCQITSTAHSRIGRSCGQILPTLTSFGSKSTVSPRRRLIGSSRLSRPANRFSRSGQPSSSSSSVQSLFGSTTSLSVGASSRNLNPIALWVLML